MSAPSPNECEASEKQRPSWKGWNLEGSIIAGSEETAGSWGRLLQRFDEREADRAAGQQREES